VVLIEFIGAIMVMANAVKPHLRANQVKMLRGNTVLINLVFSIRAEC